MMWANTVVFNDDIADITENVATAFITDYWTIQWVFLN